MTSGFGGMDITTLYFLSNMNKVCLVEDLPLNDYTVQFFILFFYVLYLGQQKSTHYSELFQENMILLLSTTDITCFVIHIQWV